MKKLHITRNVHEKTFDQHINDLSAIAAKRKNIAFSEAHKAISEIYGEHNRGQRFKRQLALAHYMEDATHPSHMYKHHEIPHHLQIKE